MAKQTKKNRRTPKKQTAPLGSEPVKMMTPKGELIDVPVRKVDVKKMWGWEVVGYGKELSNKVV